MINFVTRNPTIVLVSILNSFKRRGAENAEGRPGRCASLGDIENFLSTALGQFNTLKEVVIIVVIRNPLPSLNVMVRPT